MHLFIDDDAAIKGQPRVFGQVHVRADPCTDNNRITFQELAGGQAQTFNAQVAGDFLDGHAGAHVHAQ